MYIKTINIIDFRELINLSLNSFLLASVSSLIIVAIAIFFQFIKKISKSKTVFYLSEIVSLTYALARCSNSIITYNFFSIFNQVNWSFNSFWISHNLGICLCNEIYGCWNISLLDQALINTQIHLMILERILGMTNFKLFKKIHLPININSIYIAFILCFVDIIKELPITLILRPFNFDTLAVRTYEYAIEEMIAKSSIYSLIIILLGAVLLIFLRKIINKGVDVS